MTAIIILAAGASTRMQQPKQLLFFQNKTLLQRAIDTARATPFKPVIAVLGAHAYTLLSATDTSGIQVCINETWAEGMATSIQVGLSKLLQLQPGINSVIIMLCDQPFVTPQLLQELTRVQESSGKKIVACTYKDTLGVPVLFHHSYFSELLNLQGIEGAKKILSRFKNDTASLPFPEGETDIDTPSDWEQLLQKKAL